MRIPSPDFRHLLSLRAPYGVFEHAEYATPRVEHGHCTDDVARVLIVASREPAPSEAVASFARQAMDFLVLAQDPDGRSRNRRAATGAWLDTPTTNDCWGRSLWAFGTAVSHTSEPLLRDQARVAFTTGSAVRSPWPRAMAFAALGAVEILSVEPTNESARALLVASAAMLDRPDVAAQWCWPENRLTYANAALPEALLAAGVTFGDDRLIDAALRQLRWLLASETVDEVLNVTPVGGVGRGEHRPQFDQQPHEVAALADACVRAWRVTNDSMWGDALLRCVGWFMGLNALGEPMYDETTGGGYDGLTARGPNRNQGAESTLALLATLQQARRVTSVVS